MRLNKRIAPIAALIAACLLYATSVPSHAAVLTWTLNQVVLRQTNDPTFPPSVFIATGSFAYDAQTHAVLDWDISLVDPTVGSTIDFAPDAPCSAGPGTCTNTGTWSLYNPGITGVDQFKFRQEGFSPGTIVGLDFVTTALTDSGGQVFLVIGEGGYSGLGVTESVIAGGYLVGSAVPEPATAVYLLLGLAGLVGIGRLGRFRRGVTQQ